MTTQIETIDGVKYLVTRDGKGNIVRQAGAEDPPQLPIDPVKTAVRSLLIRDPRQWTTQEANLVLAFIARKISD